MSAPLSIEVPFPVFQDRDGQPLENGYVWLGVANLNPQTNPVIAYFDAALTIVAPQPLRTLNGYISRAGTPAQVYIDGVNFSILVQDSKGSMVYNFPEGTGISPDACGIEYDPPFAGGVGYPVCEKLEQTVSVQDFGAVGDGVTDDTAAFQAAIDAFKPTSIGAEGLPNKSINIYIPVGVYLITAPVEVYSGINLYGEGAASTLKAGPSLTTQILTLTSAINGQCRWVSISSLNFEGTGSVRAIKSGAGAFLNSIIRNNTFNIGYCIDLNIPNTYTQSVSFIDNISVGPLEQFLAIFGNRNLIENFNKESGTGSNSDPIIYAKDCSELLIRNVLIEGAGSVNKVPIRFEGCSFTIQQIWFEISNTNGYSIEFDNSLGYIYNQIVYIEKDKRKLKASNNSRIYIDSYEDGGGDDGINQTLEIDATSSVIIDHYSGRRFRDTYKLDSIKSRLKINRSLSSTGVPANGYLLANSIKYIGGNRLINPSFEAGIYGWTVGAGPTISVEPSEVSLGLMMRLTWATAGSRSLTQSFTIDAAQVGVPMTFTGLVKPVAGNVGAWASITATGAGLVGSGSDGFISIAGLGEGWQLVSQTITPLAAGTLNVGFIFFNHTEALVDNASFCYGIEGEPDRSAFGSFELNSRTFTTGPAAPVSGTWKVGDRVFNSAPSIGQPKSWVCTVAGTPGTWTSEGNL